MELDQQIQEAILSNILNMYHSTIRNIRNPNRMGLTNTTFISSRYFNNPPIGGYEINEEHEYIIRDDDDLSSLILLDVATQFGNQKVVSRGNKIKSIGKYKKVKDTNTELCESSCPICLDPFKGGEYYRSLECKHCFHKKCIDRWFKKDHSECPMCRKKIIN
jgi:hypothetical protein